MKENYNIIENQPSPNQKISTYEKVKSEYEGLARELQDFFSENNLPIAIIKVIPPSEAELNSAKEIRLKLKKISNPGLRHIIEQMIDYNTSATILDSLDGTESKDIERDDNLRDSIELKLKDLSKDKSLDIKMRKKYDKLFKFYYGNRLRLNRWNGAWTMYLNSKNQFGVDFKKETIEYGNNVHSIAWNGENKCIYKNLSKDTKVEFTKTFAKFLPPMLTDFIDKMAA